MMTTKKSETFKSFILKNAPSRPRINLMVVNYLVLIVQEAKKHEMPER